jgi:hypothetical protein
MIWMPYWNYEFMEILINELSLSGQFASVEHFVMAGLKPFIKVINDIDYQYHSLYKKSDFFQAKVTQQHTIYDTIIGNASRQYDEIRKFKSQLVMKLFNNPYWENNRKHSANNVYLYNGKNICGSSLAEACERDNIVISFCHNDFQSEQLSVHKNDAEIKIDNLLERRQFTKIEYQRNYIPFYLYCEKIFSKSKLNFSKIDSKEGFSIIKKEEEPLFFNGFRKFSELSWQQIIVDDALDYKEYNNKNYFKNIGEKIYKFRISRKYRCFGYVKDSVFFVIQFDLEHKLSDLG